MEHLKTIEHKIKNYVCTNIEYLSVYEMGEIIDMIKDLHEAMYYHSIVEAMEEASEEEKMNMIASMNPSKK